MANAVFSSLIINCQHHELECGQVHSKLSEIMIYHTSFMNYHIPSSYAKL